jgi:hypothetical protein
VDVSPCSHCDRENACLDNYECVRTNAGNQPSDRSSCSRRPE